MSELFSLLSGVQDQKDILRNDWVIIETAVEAAGWESPRTSSSLRGVAVVKFPAMDKWAYRQRAVHEVFCADISASFFAFVRRQMLWAPPLGSWCLMCRDHNSVCSINVKISPRFDINSPSIMGWITQVP